QVGGNGVVSRVGTFEPGAGSDLTQQRANNPTARFAIANPLAVQGFLTDTASQAAAQSSVPVSVRKTSLADTDHAIGPFQTPVATSPGYVNHGTSGSTTGANNQQYLRILNRSLLSRLENVRALPTDMPGDLLFRAWPGQVMNANADIPAMPENQNQATPYNNA